VPNTLSEPDPNRARIAIIGGGPGGLMTAHLLEQELDRAEITLFEAGPRLGGKIVTREFASAPVPYEAGAAELYDYSQLGPDPLRELIASLGLTVSPMRGGTVVLNGRFIKSAEDIRRELGESAHEALRRFNRRARAAISPPEYYASDWKTDSDDPLSRQTFRALLRRVPDPAARKYIEVAVHSDLATEPEHTNAVYGLQNYLMDEPEYMRLYTIEGGIERLPQEIARGLQATVRLNEPVLRVERTRNSAFRVTSRHHGETRSAEFDYVVAALPNNWLPQVDWAGERLAEAMRRHHAHYDHPGHYVRVSILFEKPFWRELVAESYFMLDAFGGCCVYDETSRCSGVQYGVLGWLLAGEAAVTLSNLDDAELMERVLDSLPAVMASGRNLFLEGRVHRWVGSVNGLPGGRPMHSPEARHRPEPIDHPRLYVVGDYLFDSTINGVLDSAEFVADRIVEEIEGPLAALPVVSGPVDAVPSPSGVDAPFAPAASTVPALPR
jgi:monoamine oxidase